MIEAYFFSLCFWMCFNQFHIVVDNLDVNSTNSVNSRAAVSAALLLLPSEFTEVDLYAKVCSLSYTGDIRTLFAEDKNKGCLIYPSMGMCTS
ncbi:hypothetical protein AAZX31_08G191400 [Glycine max]|nr:hypothetical protein GLYMA_08G193350v4 [Glycine max]KAG4399239.1 hypothetical protein GLYMA_08G193350v4 [Glycine max]KAH1052040.1 hypothetical protein GYH30_021750 [Glycine max]KAH1052041.1 hypothetical protein GYH30_021750 [Glycine max]